MPRELRTARAASRRSGTRGCSSRSARRRPGRSRGSSCRASRRRARAPRRSGRAAARRTRPWRRPARIATVIVSPILSVANIRLSRICASVEAEVGQPVVAHVLRAVAVEAVVDERARAALLRREVEAVDRRRLQADVGAARAPARRRRPRRASAASRTANLLHVHHPVTLSGTGFVLSRAVYQGISRKNRK